MKSLFVLILIICLPVLCIAQKSKKTPCKALCTIDPIMEMVEKTHYIFTGSDTTGLNVKMTTITIVESRKELVKRRKDKNCDAPNPEDCLIEVMEEIPAVTMNLYTLPGPDGTKDYDTRVEKVSVLKREGSRAEQAVVCPKNRSVKLIKKVQQGLKALGYPLVTSGILDQATNLAICDFQKNKGLPYGDLTLSTLAALGVK